MPAGLIKSLAKRYGVSTERVESAWSACKGAIHPKSGGQDGYGIVVNCVKAKLRKGGEKTAEKAYSKRAKKLGVNVGD